MLAYRHRERRRLLTMGMSDKKETIIVDEGMIKSTHHMNHQETSSHLRKIHHIRSTFESSLEANIQNSFGLLISLTQV
ncbi:MAG: hypothetical protein MRJ96_09920 [Nitrospirales bacterium]|nr:hypothetical protein [Nitrospira sp.]MDR4501753.1 hypothetical protein [Nitrospirales bacterium]